MGATPYRRIPPMPRLASALFLAVILVGVFLMPEADKARLAALHVYGLIESGETTDASGKPVLLREVLFATPAFERSGENAGVLRLGGVRFIAGPEFGAVDIGIHAELRDAVVRGLRQAASEQEIELDLRGDVLPVVHEQALQLLLRASDDELCLSWCLPGEESQERTFPWSPPGVRSILPPLFAIALALLLRRPVPALFVGVLTGAYILRHQAGDPVLTATARGFADIFGTFFWKELGNSERSMIIGFVVAMLAMVGIVTRNGGIRGIMDKVARLAGTVRSTQFAAYLMGLAVFFDDYANTILVGSTMRPLTDKLRISREKLAYIVDSTAAPVAGISIFSTWIAFEVSTFSAQLPMAGLFPSDGYAVFIDTLPYRFYCIFSLILVAIVTLSGRDLGAMLGAERRARSTGRLVREGGSPMVSDIATTMQPAAGVDIRAHRALIPLAAFIVVTLLEIARGGGAFDMPIARLLSIEGATAVLYGGSGSWPLLAGSSVGLLLAVGLSLLAGLTSDIWQAAWNTLRSMGIAIAILYLAWMLSATCAEVGTAQYLTVSLGDMQFPLFLPVLLFLLSGAVSFSTGSSWGTMSILLPLVVGLSYRLGQQIEIGGAPAGHFLMVISIGAVLEGSIFGDHCSPISDTTVLSSVASASDHIDHVRTQAPYALLCMLVAIVAGYMPCAAFGLHPLIAIALGAALLLATMRLLGRRAADPPAAPPAVLD